MKPIQPMYEVEYGTDITFKVTQPFTAADGVTVVRPDVVIFAFSVNGGTPVQFTYTEPTGDPTGTITRDPINVGYYSAKVNSATYGAGNWKWSFLCKPSTYAGDATKTAVRYNGDNLTVKPAPFAIS